jgi:mono/diheme cytochrome c family protein
MEPMLRLLLAFVFVTTSAVAADFRSFLDAHCLDCHDSDAKKGGLDLLHFSDEAAVMKDRVIWRSVYEKIESHQMPPPKQTSQPTEAERHEVMAWIMDIAARPDAELGVVDPGNPVLRRLTRLEYNNTIRDLFGLQMDVFMFPERLPLSSKAYFQPASGKMGESVDVPVREYGLKYPVLLPELGLPGENRAEHGFRNRGEAMNLSPMLLEQYLAAAREIVESPKLPQLSSVFRALIHDPSQPMRAESVIEDGEANTWIAAKEFAPNLNLPFQAKKGDVVTLDYQFRFAMQSAVADGTGGVWDATGRSIVVKAGEPIRVRFGSKVLRISAKEDVWVAGFSTAGETSGESLFTHHEKQKKVLTLDLAIEGGVSGEGITELALCALSRDKESGSIEMTATFSSGGKARLSHELITGGGKGNTFFAFRAPKGEHIVGLRLDGSKFSGNYALYDDLAFLTDGATVVATTPVAETGNKMSDRERRSVAHERLAGFLTRAFRRPVDEKMVSRYVEVFDEALDRDLPFEAAMKAALAAALTSPEFLYITEAGTGRGSVKPLADHELATRLAYFLWSAPPDDELLSAGLSDPAVLEAQTRRLMSDPRARELSESFATQWLRLDQLMTAKPDPKLFKGFYSGPQGKVTLHGSMLVEALLLFETVLVEDRSILDLLAADYTWLNARLAKLYDIDVAALAGKTVDSNVLIDAKQNAQWLRVALKDQRRGGYMTMAGPLTVTSLPLRTSPVKRGAWLLETLFNRPPQEPKIAFALKDEPQSRAAPQTVRERFEQHRDKPACYSCHVRLDPPGFALERFDAIGSWREKDGTQPVDAHAEWNGTPFDGPAEYKAILAANPHEFTRGFIEHLLSYALGRPLEIYDMPVVAKIESAAKAEGWKLSRVIVEITQSYPFTHIRSTP